MGLDNVEATSSHNADDPLTKGRVSVWVALAPDFFDSPVWGKGLSATAWNSAVTSGRIHVGHPHNFYLSLVLDMGILGALTLGYLYYRYGLTMIRLSSVSALSPLVHDYFSGAFASYVGMLVFSFTGGYYTGHPEQTFLWFSLGFCFAYWKLAEVPIAGPVRRPFGIGVRAVPSKPAGGLTPRR